MESGRAMEDEGVMESDGWMELESTEVESSHSANPRQIRGNALP
jgi:hypothetical protein